MMWSVEAHHVVLPPVESAGAPRRLGRAGDERLARLVGSGSDSAFAAIYGRYHQPIYRYCRSLTGNDADGQDALQSTFISALVALRESRRDAPLRPWLYRIAHNESISLLRKRRPEQELPDEGGPAARGPAEVLADRERLAALVADLRELPERQRGALVMRELSGLAHEEISVALGISVGAAKQTVLEARKTLQEFSEGREMPCSHIEHLISAGDRRALRARRVRAHLRSCDHCNAFASAIDQRRTDLMAIAPPLPALAAAGLLSNVFGGAAGAGAGHAAGGAGLAAGAAGKGIGAALTAKGVLTGAAIVAATAAVGATAIHGLTGRSAPAGRTAPTHSHSATPSAGAGPRHSATGAHHRSSAAKPGTKRRYADTRSRHRTHAHPRGSGAGVTSRSTTPSSSRAGYTAGASAAVHGHGLPITGATRGTKTRAHGTPLHRHTTHTRKHAGSTAHTHGKGTGAAATHRATTTATTTTTSTTDATSSTGGGSGKSHAVAK